MENAKPEIPNRTIAFLCCLMSIFMAISIDIYLPSLPSIAKTFAVTLNESKFSLSIFLIGFAISQLFYGIISDYFGRRLSLLVGLAIYFASSIGCAFSPSINVLIFFRLMQSFGACGASVSSYALARDTYEGNKLTKILAMMAIIMTIVPSIAPLVGGIIDKTVGWRYSFFLLAFISFVTIVITYFYLQKDCRKKTASFVLRNPLNSYIDFILDKNYISYVLISASVFVALYFFISASPFLLIENLHITQTQYGLIMAVNALALIVGNNIAMKINSNALFIKTMLIGTILMFLGSIIIMLLSSLNTLYVIFPVLLCSVGIGVISPISMSAALQHQKSRAGQASAFAGFLRFSLAVLISMLFNPELRITAFVIASCAIVNLALLFFAQNYAKQELSYES